MAPAWTTYIVPGREGALASVGRRICVFEFLKSDAAWYTPKPNRHIATTSAAATSARTAEDVPGLRASIALTENSGAPAAGSGPNQETPRTGPQRSPQM